MINSDPTPLLTVAAGIVSTPVDYYWQTHNHYLSRDHLPWVEKEFCLSLFSDNFGEATKMYTEFMESSLTPEELNKIQDPAFGYIIGDDHFVTMVQAKAEERILIQNIDSKLVLIETCKYFCYPPSSIKLQTKDPEAAKIRGIAGYIISNYTNPSLTLLRSLTNRNASTLSHSIKKISTQVQYDNELKKLIDQIIGRITR